MFKLFSMTEMPSFLESCWKILTFGTKNKLRIISHFGFGVVASLSSCHNDDLGLKRVFPHLIPNMNLLVYPLSVLDMELYKSPAYLKTTKYGLLECIINCL